MESEMISETTGNASSAVETEEINTFSTTIDNELYKISLKSYCDMLTLRFVDDIYQEIYEISLNEQNVEEITNKAGLELSMDDFYALLKAAFEGSESYVKLSDVSIIKERKISFKINFVTSTIKSKEIIKTYELSLPYFVQNPLDRITNMVTNLVLSNREMKERIHKLEEDNLKLKNKN